MPKPKTKTKAEQRLDIWKKIKNHVDQLWPASSVERSGFEVVDKSAAQKNVAMFEKQFMRMYKQPEMLEWDRWLDRLEATLRLSQNASNFRRGSRQETLSRELTQLIYDLNRLGPS